MFPEMLKERRYEGGERGQPLTSYFLSGKFLEDFESKRRKGSDIFTQDTLGRLQASRA